MNNLKQNIEKQDPRTVDKLFRRLETHHNRDCWLAPLCYRGHAQEQTGITNSMFLLFKIPIVVGCIKVRLSNRNHD